jgi:hypothetical protein
MLRLYTDESPGLKVDPVVVLVLSLGFIMSVVALHSESNLGEVEETDVGCTLLTGTIVIAKITRRFA